MNSDGKIISL